VGKPKFPALLAREGGQLAERVLIRPAVSATAAHASVIGHAQPATPDPLRQPLVARQNAGPATAPAASGGWLSQVRRRLAATFGAGGLSLPSSRRRSRQQGGADQS